MRVNLIGFRPASSIVSISEIVKRLIERQCYQTYMYSRIVSIRRTVMCFEFLAAYPITSVKINVLFFVFCHRLHEYHCH